MANGFPLSSGLALSSSVQGMLERDRNLKRQALLDALNEKQVNAQLENQKLAAEATKAYRDSQKEAAKSLSDQRTLAGLDSAQFEVGTNLAGQLDPEKLQVGKDYGRITGRPADYQQGNEESFDEGGRWAGSPVQRQQKQVMSFIDSLPPDTDPSTIAKLRIAAQFGKDLTGSELATITSPQSSQNLVRGHDGVLRDDKGKAVWNVPKGATISDVDRTPANPSTPYIGTSNGQPVLLVNGKPTIVPLQGGKLDPNDPNAAPLKIEPKPSNTPPRQSPRPITDRTQATLAKLSSDWAKLAARSPNSNPAIAAKTAYITNLKSALGGANLSPDMLHLKQMASQALEFKLKKDPRAANVQDIVERAKATGALKNDHEAAVFGDLLTSIFSTVPSVP